VVTAPEGYDTSANVAPYFVDLNDVDVFAGQRVEIILRPVDPDGDYAGMFPERLPAGAGYEDNFDGRSVCRRAQAMKTILMARAR